MSCNNRTLRYAQGEPSMTVGAWEGCEAAVGKVKKQDHLIKDPSVVIFPFSSSSCPNRKKNGRFILFHYLVGQYNCATINRRTRKARSSDVVVDLLLYRAEDVCVLCLVRRRLAVNTNGNVKGSRIWGGFIFSKLKNGSMYF